MSSSPVSSPRRRRRVVVGIVLVVAGLAAGWLLGLWFFSGSPGDMTAAMAANSRGVAHMEKYEYEEASAEFERAARLAPNWLPAQINLGIARLNVARPEDLRKAEEIFEQVLVRDPKNAHAIYCLGMIAFYENRLAEAYPRFDAVTQIDPLDAHAWLNKGVSHPNGNDSAEAKACFERALALDPYLNAARYAIAQHPHGRDPERSRQLLEEHRRLLDATWQTLSGIKYGEMGRYADVIGRDAEVHPNIAAPLPLFEQIEDFQVKLPAGARWATADDLTPFHKTIRERFGGTLVLLDYDRDGLPDVFMLAAVVEAGKVRDLLVRNDGHGRLTGVLATPAASLGCAVGDFDNDGLPDLILTREDGVRLFHNTGKEGFEDVTVKAGLDQVRGTCLAASWVDLDQDGDLDLLLGQVPGPGKDRPGGLRVFVNVGEAKPTQPGEEQLGLTAKFRPAEGLDVPGKGGVVGLAVSDLDSDRDVDLLILPDGSAPTVSLNDRLLRFHQARETLTDSAATGALILDANHDERSDVLLLSEKQPPALLLQQPAEGDDLAQRFTAGQMVSPALKQAQVVDLNMDGWPDVLGLSADRKAVLLQNDGRGRLVEEPGAIGPVGWLPADVLAVAAADFDGDCASDVLLWSERDGLHLRRNLGNGNFAVRLDISGRRDKSNSTRSNADGLGAWVIAQAGTVWTGQENTTLNAGLGQSRLPVELGIGRQAKADAVRVRWPDSVVPAELNVAACQVVRIKETPRKIDSCPVLFTWDGERFRYVTDMLGAGSLGEVGTDGSVRTPRPEESVKIESGMLRPRDGQYILKIAEPLDELMYLDRVQLVVIDHPRDASVFPEERFVTSGPQPSQELLPFGGHIFPVKATDHKGRDVTAAIREQDRTFVAGFAQRAWPGYAEDHFVVLDFADRLKDIKEKDRLFLVLAGWTDYPYREAMCAATQAGVELQPPVIERFEEGAWKPLGDLGFPAGLPRVITREVTGLLTGPSCKLRLRTNMQVFWDQIYLATLDAKDLKVTPLEVSGATLASEGFFQELRPDGKSPVVYDAERTEAVAVSRWEGRLTRLGDVTELLQKTDDRLVLCGPGDAVTVRFDARNLPALPDGWERSFVLKSWGYCKDTSPFTLTGGKVGPLPYRAMSAYPPEVEGPGQAEYDRAWNTRPAGAMRERRPGK